MRTTTCIPHPVETVTSSEYANERKTLPLEFVSDTYYLSFKQDMSAGL